MLDKKENMNLETYGGYIAKVIFNNGQSIEINKNDIVIFVGPNNVGKSQALKDLYALCKKKEAPIVVGDIEIVKYDTKPDKLLKTMSVITDHGTYQKYSGFGYDLGSYDIDRYKSDKYYGELRSVFVAYLNTLNRLKISNPADLISRKAAKTHPIHYVAFEQKYRQWISANFKKAFGEELIPFTQNGNNIPLCIGKQVKFNDEEFSDEQTRQEAYEKVLETYKQVQDQGDGIKSFTGILLYLMLDYYSIFLIDEPESFLHPPQANIMGRIIGETLSDNQQAFISTHSEEIIKGLLEVCPERVKVIRITRVKDNNSFSILENKKFSEIWKDPLLKYSNIMASLFHKEVILCESDSDCRMYSIIENYLKGEKGKYSGTLFIHCSGKHRMARIANALKALNIQVKLIPDIDVLNDVNIFKGIVNAFGIEWKIVEKSYNTINANLHSRKEKIVRTDFKNTVLDILDNSDTTTLSNKEIKDIIVSLKIESKWETLKKSGISALPSGDATQAFDELNEILKQAGIFIVPVGELECFVKQVGGHGPDWTNKVLEKYPDLSDRVYDEIKNFIKIVCNL